MSLPSPVAIMENIEKVGVIVNTVSIGMGLFFILVGFIKLKRYGEMRSYMSQQMTILGPLMYLLVGSFLLYLPTTLQIVSSAIWADNNPLAPTGYWGTEWMRTIAMFIRLLGVIGVVRGLAGLANTGGQGQPGKISKSFLFIIGGVMCIHVIGTVDLLKEFVNWNYQY